MNSDVISTQDRAVILGGGGSTGNAWLIGVVAGLYGAGVDVTDAQLTVGTSAGATAAAQVSSGTPPAELLASSLSAPRRPSAGTPVPAIAPTPAGSVPNHVARLRELIRAAASPADMRRRIGAAALEQEAASPVSEPSRWRAVVAGRLPHHQWPRQRMLITAVDADTGEPVTFDRNSGVDLVDAVAASTSNGFGVPPYAIGDRRYLDGGYRRNENADLAAGYARVLVLSPFSGRSLHPPSWGMDLAAQVHELQAGGSRVEKVFPPRESERLFGANAMDLSLRPAAARVGYEQGADLAEPLGAFWR